MSKWTSGASASKMARRLSAVPHGTVLFSTMILSLVETAAMVLAADSM